MSTLTAYTEIPERAEATPSLFNTILSTLSANIRTASEGPFTSASTDTLSFTTNLLVSGGGKFQFLSVGSTPPSEVTTAAVIIGVNSAFSDYLYLTDSSGARSNYVIGSRAGGTADGLNIWDASGDTMIATFSKQSIRFWQNVVGPVFDTGGALADTYNAATFIGSGSSISGLQAAINQASTDSVSRVYVPSSMYPYSASSISFINSVQLIREGGNQVVYDVRAYGSFGDGLRDDTAAFQAAHNGSRHARSAVIYVPSGTYKISHLSMIDQTTLEGESREGSIINSIATDGATILVAGTVDISGVNRATIRRLTIQSTASNGPRAVAIALLYGGSNILEDLRINAASRMSDCIVMDQQVVNIMRGVYCNDFLGAGLYIPWTSGYTRYAVTTTAFGNVIHVVGCNFNSAGAVARGIIADNGEAMLVEQCNFSSLAVGMQLSRYKAYLVQNNYFERTSALSGTTQVPAIWLRDSNRTGGTTAPCNGGMITANHVEWAVDTITGSNQNGATIVVDRHIGNLRVVGNQFATETTGSGEAGYVLRVVSAISALEFWGNSDVNEDHAKTFGHTGISFATTVTNVATRFDRTELVYPSQVSRLGFGGKSLWFDTSTGATGKTFERGDVLFDPNGETVYLSTASGTIGTAGATNVNTSLNSSMFTTNVGGNNGNVEAGDWVAIAGAGGPYRIKEMFTLLADNKITFVAESNITASVTNAAISFAAPSFYTIGDGQRRIVAGPTDFILRNNADSASNFRVLDGGEIAFLGTSPSLTFGGSNTTIIPGTAEFVIRNNADSQTNIRVFDSGDIRFRGDPLLLSGQMLFSGSNSTIIAGTVQTAFRNNADSATNLLIADAGVVTFRNQVITSGSTIRLAEAPTGGALAGDATGTAGDIAWGSSSGVSFLYVCVSANSWMRATLNPF